MIIRKFFGIEVHLVFFFTVLLEHPWPVHWDPNPPEGAPAAVYMYLCTYIPVYLLQ